eukprot:1421504-Pyramimonas_sp.AAC.1
MIRRGVPCGKTSAASYHGGSIVLLESTGCLVGTFFGLFWEVLEPSSGTLWGAWEAAGRRLRPRR